MPRTILVTGGAGFIGSNFIHYVLSDRDDTIVNLDLLTYAGNSENLAEVAEHPRYRFIKGDVRDREVVRRVFAEHSPDWVVHFAAETHVDRSITGPEAFLTTNVLGTQVLLDAARESWCGNPQDKYCKEYKTGVKYLQVSTDEVYGALGATGKFTEETPLSPNSPYSASKAGADLLVRAYHETFGLPVSITRCSNNYGPYQFPEKLIPLMLQNAVEGKTLPVYGDGMQVRDWLYVDDHCTAILAVLEKGAPGEVYNIGGDNERANLEIVRLILRETGRDESLIRHVADRPGHDRRYAIDNAKITSELGWKPAYAFEEGMAKTIRWYKEHAAWLARVTSGAYREYYADMYGEA